MNNKLNWIIAVTMGTKYIVIGSFFCTRMRHLVIVINVADKFASVCKKSVGYCAAEFGLYVVIVGS